MTKYRTRSVIIEAIQYNFYNKNKIDEFVGYTLAEYSNNSDDKVYDTYLIIPTSEGNMRADVGDYIINIKGEFYPCARDTFEELYEEINNN